MYVDVGAWSVTAQGIATDPERLASVPIASRTQPGDAHRIGGRHVAVEDLRMAGRRQTGDIDDVLDADGNAVQRPPQAPGARLGFGEEAGLAAGQGQEGAGHGGGQRGDAGDRAREALRSLHAGAREGGDFPHDDLPRAIVEIVYADVDPVLWGAAELSVRAQLAHLTKG